MENDPRMDDFIRAMTPAQKLRAASQLYFSARKMKAAWFRANHPDWSEDKIQQEVRYVFIAAAG